MLAYLREKCLKAKEVRELPLRQRPANLLDASQLPESVQLDKERPLLSYVGADNTLTGVSYGLCFGVVLCCVFGIVFVVCMCFVVRGRECEWMKRV